VIINEDVIKKTMIHAFVFLLISSQV